MAVAILTSMPHSFVSGDSVRVKIADSRYPSSLWTLKVWFQRATTTVDYTAPANVDGGYDLFITPTQSAALAAGKYLVGFVFTEIALPNDRATGDEEFLVQVFANPAVARPKTTARLTLEAMEAAYLLLAAGVYQSVNFNGQSFTKRNLKDFQDAITRQKAIVTAEDITAGSKGVLNRIVHRMP